jgi:hypothetical protein
MNPVSPAPISSGTAQRISFLTPGSDVNVDAPVKFMARYAVIAGTRRSHAMVSNWPDHEIISGCRTIMSIQAVRRPSQRPFNAKGRTGMNGNKIGIRIVPIVSAYFFTSL